MFRLIDHCSFDGPAQWVSVVGRGVVPARCPPVLRFPGRWVVVVVLGVLQCGPAGLDEWVPGPVAG